MNIKIFTHSIFCLSLYANLGSAQQAEPSQDHFEGTIHYKMTYTDMKGVDITKKVAAFFDSEQHLFVNEDNYKVLNQFNQHVKLYQSKNNAYFFFNRDNTAYKIDQTAKTSQFVKVYEVDDVDTILGYPCKAVKVDADFRAYIYFYNPAIRVDVGTYKNYNMEEWNAYLKAADGALPLRVITIDIRSKFIEDKRAVKVTAKELMASDFDFPKNVKLKKLKYGIDMVW